MFGLLKKSKPQQDVYFPFKTVFEKDELIFDKKQFASNGFDFVQKQRKRQNRCDDEKWVRSGDRPFTKAKRSNRDVPYQNELKTYASWEKMLHKAIHAVQQLKKKRNTNTSSAPKQQKTKDETKTDAMMRSWSEVVIVPSPKPREATVMCLIRTSFRLMPAGKRCCIRRFKLSGNSKRRETPTLLLHQNSKVRSTNRTDQTDRAVPRASRLELRLEPRPDDRTDRTTARLPRPTLHSKTHGRARLSLGREEAEDGHAFLSGGPSGQSSKRPYLYPVHPSGSNELQTYASLEKMLHKAIHVVRSSDRTGHTDRAVPRAYRLELRLEPRPDDRLPRTEARLPRPTRHSKTHGRVRLSLGGEETEDGRAFSSGRPSGQSRKRPYRYPVHPSGSDEPGHLD
ncbi:hypothetical protein DY000_02025569 [Brassica cretica]|uniref:Uncharacterized protein n=1 Tax=Brassica cretica TaxID=69181 RepID=A0ABQ7E1C6_BRACR|nr:hypothetical protein DY000_02025569 [Brassica cretica]